MAGFYVPPSSKDANNNTFVEDSLNQMKINEAGADQDKEADDSPKDEEDDDEGWIKPSNLEKMKSQVDTDKESIGSKRLKVACMTSDFSMQVHLGSLYQFGI